MLVLSNIGVLLGTAEVSAKIDAGSGSKGFETVDLMSNVGNVLVGSAPPLVVTGTKVASGIDVVFFLEAMVS